MSNSFVIEIGDDQVGIVIRDAGEHDFRFHAALSAYQALDGRRFASPASAEKAAVAHRAGLRSRPAAFHSQRAA